MGEKLQDHEFLWPLGLIRELGIPSRTGRGAVRRCPQSHAGTGTATAVGMNAAVTKSRIPSSSLMKVTDSTGNASIYWGFVLGALIAPALMTMQEAWQVRRLL